MGPVCRALVVLAAAATCTACTTMGDVLAAIEGSGSSETGTDGSSTAGETGEANGGCGSPAATWWCPTGQPTWQNQRIGPLDYAVEASIFDVALFEVDATMVETLHGQGRDVICWFSAGISYWNDPDRDTVLPATGNPPAADDGLWMDLDSTVVRDAMLARLDLAVAHGCDAIEPGDLDGYLGDSGLPLTRTGTIAFVRWLAENAHARELAVALQDANELAGDLEPALDLAIDYGCLAAGTCDRLAGFVAAEKLVLHVELIEATDVAMVEQRAVDVCARSDEAGLVTIFKKPDLNAWQFPCD